MEIRENHRERSAFASPSQDGHGFRYVCKEVKRLSSGISPREAKGRVPKTDALQKFLEKEVSKPNQMRPIENNSE
jgi:hypothetical protein